LHFPTYLVSILHISFPRINPLPLQPHPMGPSVLSQPQCKSSSDASSFCNEYQTMPPRGSLAGCRPPLERKADAAFKRRIATQPKKSIRMFNVVLLAASSPRWISETSTCVYVSVNLCPCGQCMHTVCARAAVNIFVECACVEPYYLVPH